MSTEKPKKERKTTQKKEIKTKSNNSMTLNGNGTEQPFGIINKQGEDVIQDLPTEEEEYFDTFTAAQYLHVTEDAIKLYIQHGHIELQTIEGRRVIPLSSLLRCRIKVHLSNFLPNKAYFRPEEVASFLSISKSTVYKWIDEEKIEAVTVGQGKTLRISRDVVEKMIQPRAE